MKCPREQIQGRFNFVFGSESNNNWTHDVALITKKNNVARQYLRDKSLENRMPRDNRRRTIAPFPSIFQTSLLHK